MEKRSVEAIVRALNDAGVRYLIVGGLAVVAHGYLRFTADVDLIVDLHEENLRRALAALEPLGYRPRLPVPIEQLLDPDTRAQWIREKGMKVFSLISTQHQRTDVDLFVEDPLGFERAYADATRVEVAPDITGTFVALDDLILMKTQAGRPRDMEDIQQLQKLRRQP
ncbi:MAG: hypothetical protein HY000_06150 [Planctomycetes bacterium]|nr:hypothetical protein [Planctomycetota bacterium]